MSVLIKNAEILLMEGQSGTQKTNIVIEGQKIAKVSTDLDPAVTYETVIDANGMLVLPGLINCHQHTPMTLLRTFSDDLRLMDWLEKKILPAESRMTEEDIYWGSMLSCAEMIKSGTTSFADMYIHMNVIAEVVEKTGMRAALARGLVFFEDDKGRRLNEAIDLIEKWNGKGDGRITTMFAPHAPYTCPPEKLSDVIELARRMNQPIHTHLAETREESQKIYEKYQKTPTEYYYDLGLFDDTHVLLAHSVFLSENDIALLRDHLKGGISHNPTSNLKLGCGIAPVISYRNSGIHVGLGTDGTGSSGTLDLFQEIRLATLLQKVTYEDPTVLNASQVIQMATEEGAHSLGLKKLGRITEGFTADLILIDLNKVHLTPPLNPASLVAYCCNGSDVDTTIIHGKVVMRNRTLLTIDEERVKFEAKERAARITRDL